MGSHINAMNPRGMIWYDWESGIIVHHQVGHVCREAVIVTAAQLTHHRSAVVRDEVHCVLRELHRQHGVWSQSSSEIILSMCRLGPHGCTDL